MLTKFIMISYIRNTTWPTENCYDLRYFNNISGWCIVRNFYGNNERRQIDQRSGHWSIFNMNNHNYMYKIVRYFNYFYYFWLISHQAFSLCHPSEHMLINFNVLNYEIPIKATTIRQQHYMGSIKETFQTKIVLFCCL